MTARLASPDPSGRRSRHAFRALRRHGSASTSSRSRILRCRGSTTWAARSTSASSPTPPAATRSTATPGCAGSPDTATTASRPTPAAGTCTCATRKPATSGRRRGSRRGRTSRTTAAGTGSATRVIGSAPDGYRGRDDCTSSRSARPSRSGARRSSNHRDRPAPSSRCSARSSSASGTPSTTPPTSSATSRSARSRWGRRRRHLPHDRVPGAAQPLRLLRLLGTARRLRHPARSVPRAVPRLGPAGGGRAGRVGQLGRPRLGAVRLPPRRARRSVRGRRREVVFLLGYGENPADAKFDPPGSTTIDKRPVRPVIERYLRPARSMPALRPPRRALGRAARRRCRSPRPSPHADRMVNIWNAYQCMVTFNLSRSASLFESGIGRGMGFRDSNQDLLGFVHMVPERARERILDIAATQLPTGGAYHQYQPLTKRGNDAIGSGFNDDPLWLILAVAAYVKETGDQAHPRRGGALRQRAGSRGAARTSTSSVPLQYTLERLGPARPAADRAGRLERLPQPQLLLRDARRVVPDDREPRGRRRRVGVHRRAVRAGRRASWPRSPSRHGAGR